MWSPGAATWGAGSEGFGNFSKGVNVIYFFPLIPAVGAASEVLAKSIFWNTAVRAVFSQGERQSVAYLQGLAPSWFTLSSLLTL